MNIKRRQFLFLSGISVITSGFLNRKLLSNSLIESATAAKMLSESLVNNTTKKSTTLLHESKKAILFLTKTRLRNYLSGKTILQNNLGQESS